MPRLAMKRLEKGMKVVTTVERDAYYAGGKDGAREPIPAGREGVIGAVGVPAVRRLPGMPTEFVCVDFPDGNRAAYYVNQIKLVKE